MVADVQSSSRRMMSREQLIENIRRYNRSVSPMFLSRFDHDALRTYFSKLRLASDQSRGRVAWVRRVGPPAIVGEAAPD